MAGKVVKSFSGRKILGEAQLGPALNSRVGPESSQSFSFPSGTKCLMEIAK